MPIDADFAADCVEQGLYCGINPHYLLGVASLRSAILEGQNGQIGPFRLTQAQWDANRTDDEFAFDFLPDDIKEPDMQCAVFALMAHRAFDAFFLKNNRNPSAKELYLQQWPNTPVATISADLGNALTVTAVLVDPAAKKVLDEPLPPPLIINDPNQQPPGPSDGAFQLNTIPPARRPIATKILDAFAKAGFGKFQQATALANAIAESALNPSAHAGVGEDSWGLFQLNRKGGLGKGHNPDELKNPDRNIAIVLAEASKYAEFTHAVSLSQAVSAFVRDVERPSNIPGEIINRLKIAQKILP